ncbi:MAG TPA: hypothetical protein VEQ58_07565 [Polyangiaceae bacterium]|nr:hypothetical protein [Polyangiaceae bacterium]
MKLSRLFGRSLQISCATFLMLGACSSGSSDDGGGKAGNASSSTAGSGAAPSSNTAGSSPSAGSGGVATSSGGSGTGNVAGSSSSTAGGGGRGGVSSGGTPGSSGAPASTGGGGSGTGGSAPTSGDCSRDFLKTTLTAYFAALAAHSSMGLPLADTVKATENGKAIMVGQDGLWKTAGAVKYYKSALDTEGCNTASEAVVPEGSADLPVALRLKIVGQKITEIETIAVRAGDYKVSGSDFPSKPDAIVMSDTSVMWEAPVPTTMRNTTQEMNAWMSKYFKAFPAGVCNADTNCKRLENGNSPGGCNLGASCQAGDATGNVIKSHAIFSDVETGIGVGFDAFMGNADMHFFKMYGGKVYAVHAILGTASSTGWDDK